MSKVATRRLSLAAGILLLALPLSACTAPETPPGGTPNEPTTTPPVELPHGDGELVLGSLLPLSGDLRTQGQAMLSGIELAIRDINAVAGQEYLGGLESQPNIAYGLTIAAHHRVNTASENSVESRQQALTAFSEQGVDLVITGGSETEASQLLTTLDELKIPLVLPGQLTTGFTQRSQNLVLADTDGTGLVAAELKQLVADQSAQSIVYLYLPNERGNALQRNFAGWANTFYIPDAAEQDENTDDVSDETTSSTTLNGYQALPVIVEQDADEQSTAEVLAGKIAELKPDVLAIYLPVAEETFAAQILLEQVRHSGLAPEQIVLLGSNPARLWEVAQDQLGAENTAFEGGIADDPNDENLMAQVSGFAGVRALVPNLMLSTEFAGRIRQIDPWTPVNLAGQQAYDAVIRIQLARLLAEDDNGQRIAQEFLNVSNGAAQCASYAECVHVLNTRTDIHYLGSAAYFDKLAEREYVQVLRVAVQQDNSLSVLNGDL